MSYHHQDLDAYVTICRGELQNFDKWESTACSDILITETETKTRMSDLSFTETIINTERILKTKTI